MADSTQLVEDRDRTVEQAEAALDLALVNYKSSQQTLHAAAGTVHFAFALSPAVGLIERAVTDLKLAWYREHGRAEDARREAERSRP